MEKKHPELPPELIPGQMELDFGETFPDTDYDDDLEWIRSLREITYDDEALKECE